MSVRLTEATQTNGGGRRMETQHQVHVHGPDDVRVDEVDVPRAGTRDVVVRVAACGICGSDVGYVRSGGLMGPTDAPMALGHELSGVVESVGADVVDWSVGDRVVVDPMGSNNMIGNGGSEGGFTPRLLVRDVAAGGGLIRVPDGLPLSMAALAEPLGVGMRAVDRSRAEPGEKVVVMGAGPIGLAVVACLVDRGVDDVVVIDFSQTRLDLAVELGARAGLKAYETELWSNLKKLHGTTSMMGMPVVATDIFIEATGAGAAFRQLIAQARGAARIVIVGLHKAPVEVNLVEVMMKELDLMGSIAQPEDWTRMLDLLARRDLSSMVTHQFSLAEFSSGIAVARDPAAGGKVMIRVDPELD